MTNGGRTYVVPFGVVPRGDLVQLRRTQDAVAKDLAFGVPIFAVDVVAHPADPNELAPSGCS